MFQSPQHSMPHHEQKVVCRSAESTNSQSNTRHNGCIVQLDSPLGEHNDAMKAQTTASPLEMLPTELLLKIYRLLDLDPSTILAFKLTSRTMYTSTFTETGKELVDLQWKCRKSPEQLSNMMIKIEKDLSEQVLVRRLTCSSCFRCLGHGADGELVFGETIPQYYLMTHKKAGKDVYARTLPRVFSDLTKNARKKSSNLHAYSGGIDSFSDEEFREVSLQSHLYRMCTEGQVENVLPC